MPVALVDVGSNTVRLLVAVRRLGRVEPLLEERAALSLGEEIARYGFLSPDKLVETGKVARRYARRARELGCREITVIVTAPGRSAANAGELVHVLQLATAARVRVLSPEEEGILAFDGATAAAGIDAGHVAVCDVGGGSTEVVAGDADTGGVWVRSLPIGSLALTVRCLEAGVDGRALVRARGVVEELLEEVEPPACDLALATGGSARAIAKIGGRVLGADEFEHVMAVVARATSRDLAKAYGIDRDRARTVAAGAVILRAVHERLELPLEVARGGLREGAALSLLEQPLAA